MGYVTQKKEDTGRSLLKCTPLKTQINQGIPVSQCKCSDSKASQEDVLNN